MNIVLIFLVLVAAVWILGQVIRGAQEASNEERRKEARTSRPPSPDIDRFLEEVDRLRRQATQERRSPSSSSPPSRRPASPPPPPPGRRLPEPARPRTLDVLPVATAVVPPPAAPPATPTPRAARGRPPSREVSRIVKLLGDPQSIRIAFLLREILDAPRSHRPLRRRI